MLIIQAQAVSLNDKEQWIQSHWPICRRAPRPLTRSQMFSQHQSLGPNGHTSFLHPFLRFFVMSYIDIMYMNMDARNMYISKDSL